MNKLSAEELAGIIKQCLSWADVLDDRGQLRLHVESIADHIAALEAELARLQAVIEDAPVCPIYGGMIDGECSLAAEHVEAVAEKVEA